MPAAMGEEGVAFRSVVVLAHIAMGRFGSTLGRASSKKYDSAFRPSHTRKTCQETVCTSLISPTSLGYTVSCWFIYLNSVFLNKSSKNEQVAPESGK
jgi:hypothetical protein